MILPSNIDSTSYIREQKIIPGIYLQEVIRVSASKKGDVKSPESMPNKLNLARPFDPNQIKQKLKKYSNAQNSTPQPEVSAEAILSLSTGSLEPSHLLACPLLFSVATSTEYLGQVDGDELWKVAAWAIAALNQSNKIIETESLSSTILCSAAQTRLPPAASVRLHAALCAALGSATYLRLYNDNAEKQMLMPAAQALEANDDLSYLRSFSYYHERVSRFRAKELGNFEQSAMEEAQESQLSTMSKTPKDVAKKLLNQAIEDPTLVSEVEQVINEYFKRLHNNNLRNSDEFRLETLLDSELVIDYFFKLKQRISYSEKAIYLDLKSITNFLKFCRRGHDKSGTLMGLFAVKKIIDSGKSTDSVTEGFVYKMLPDEVRILAEAHFSIEQSKQYNAPSLLIGYLAAQAEVIEVLCHLVLNNQLNEKLSNLAYDTLARHVVLNNPPKSLDSILRKLRENIGMGNSLTDFGMILEGVIVPILNNNFEKAWKTAYSSIVLPAQKELMTELLLEMLQRHYDSQHMKPAGDILKNERLKATYFLLMQVARLS